jgi:hypothetical protein
MDTLAKAALEAIERFYKMTPNQWAELEASERGFIAGCILGNYSAHHPREAYDLLKQIKPKQ